MGQKFNVAGTRRSQVDRTLDANLVTIDLSSFIGQIRKEEEWGSSDRNAITVFKTNSMRIVLIALHKGAEMTRHKADGLINVQVLEGEMLFITDEQSIELGQGQMLVLHKGISHSVLAKEETIFLLTITTTLVDLL